MHDIKLIKERASSLRILVVDDDTLIRALMSSFMERIFGEVVSAMDGQEALEKFDEFGTFDVVLTDIRMPRMNGRELIKELRARDEKLFIAVMSGAPEEAGNDLEYCNMFLAKPVGFDNILEMLSIMIQNKES